MSELIERVQTLWQRTQDLDFIDDSLGLTRPEKSVLAALLVTGGDYAAARKLLGNFDKPTFDRQAVGLRNKGFIGREGNQIVFNDTTIRLQEPHETERQPGKPPQLRVVYRSIRDQVLVDVQSDSNPVRGLAKVYGKLYGGDFSPRTFGLLGKMLKALGPTRAALFLLEFAHKPMENPLVELLPLAVSRGKGYGNVQTAEAIEARKDNDEAMERAALKGRLKVYSALGSIPEYMQDQYELDQAAWKRLGCPPLEEL